MTLILALASHEIRTTRQKRKKRAFARFIAIRLCGKKIGRGDRIRTCDPHTPSVMRYQAALRPDRAAASRRVLSGMQALMLR